MTYRRYTSGGLRRRVTALAILTLALCSSLVVGAAGAGATGEGGAGAPEQVAPRLAAAGVTVGGVPVGGLTAEEAERAVRRSFARPLELTFRGETRRYAPARLGAEPALAEAVAGALVAKPGSDLPLTVAVSERRVRSLARALGRSFDRKPVDATIALRGTKPTVTKPRKGFRVERAALAASLRHALKTHERGPLAIPHAVVAPAVTRRNIGPVVVVLRESKQLRLYDGVRLRARFGIATGQASFPTPTGTYEVVTMQRSPWWYPPPSDWAEGLEPVPPGPGNPLGTRWMGLSAEFVGIHGTPDAASIGYSASHGCIRMHISDAEWLFERVRVGTPVYILSA